LEEGFFLQKPFSRDRLVRKVDEALGHEQKSGAVDQLSRSSRDRTE
jgi:FixJ family two-component response regulator